MSDPTWTCPRCEVETPGHEFRILAGCWYCRPCYAVAEAEYNSPEAQARREEIDAQAETAWPRTLEILAGMGCTPDMVADEQEWQHLCGDICCHLEAGEPFGRVRNRLAPGYVALYTRGDLSMLPEEIARIYVLSTAERAGKPRPRLGQIDLFAPTASRPAIYPRKRLGR